MKACILIFTVISCIVACGKSDNSQSGSQDLDNSLTPLSAAVIRGDIDAVKKYIQNGSQINEKSKDGVTALHIAASLGNSECVSILIENGANPNVYCMLYGHELGIPAPPTVNIRNGAKARAIHSHRSNIVGDTPLHAAIKANSNEIVKQLLDSGADPNAISGYACSPLVLAVQKGSLQMIDLLISNGADPNARTITGWSAGCEAVFAGNISVLEKLIDSGFVLEDTDLESKPQLILNPPQNAMLFTAVVYGTPTMVKWLLEQNSDPTIKKTIYHRRKLGTDQVFPGTTPFHLSLQLKKNMISEVFLDVGLSPDTPLNDGSTALHIAAGSGNSDAVKLLLNHNADTTVRNSIGLTPLQTAADNGHRKIVEKLQSYKQK